MPDGKDVTFTSKPVEIPVNKQIMRGTLYRPEGDGLKPAIVIFHGRGSQQLRHTDRAATLAAAGFITLVFSFRGCGESDGEFSEQTAKMGLEDALAGYDFLLKQDSVDASRIGVIGGSYGGYLATILTEQRPVKALALAVPAIYKNEWWDIVPESKSDEHKKYSHHGDFSDNQAIKTIREYSGALLLIEHEFDEICPKRVTRAYFDNAVLASPRQQAMVAGVGHRWTKKEHHHQSVQFTVDFFTKTLS